MENLVFVINCGSSSIKFQLIEPNSQQIHLKGLAENLDSDRCRIKSGDQEINLPNQNYDGVLKEILRLITPFEDKVCAIGHRVVHGGEYFYSSMIIDDEVLSKIKKCAHLAPLHNPVNAKGIEALLKRFPKILNVAVFDTAFHMSMPNHAYLYALPIKFYKENQIRRYGFHGTSHRFISEQATKLLPDHSKLIIAHLGNGSSVCAVKDGKSVDTSMGFTPLEGLVMGTRSGDLDPSILTYLSKELNISAEEALTICNSKSGLLGISEISSDMRLLEEKAIQKDPQAMLAIEMFCYRLAKYIASYTVPLKGCDGLIFTGGIGENSHFIRSKVINYLPNFSIDEKIHEKLKRGASGIISSLSSPHIAVIPTNEELMIAQDALKLKAAI
ncbi:MAG: Acetate kinase [Chlamydiia bacterium]|nr:Acetate kinase [Chlamydiia bacterium]